MKNPFYVTTSPDRSVLVSSGGTNKIYKLIPEKLTAKLFIDTEKAGMMDIGNCICDLEGNIWINEIRGCRVWQFDSKGNKKLVLGDGKPGFQKDPVSFEDVSFNWIYDLRLGPEGNVYVLDSKNFAVRFIDLQEEKVYLKVGTGKPGYSGDNDDALKATLGSNPKVYYDGPISLSVDEIGNIYIGDVHNHVVRMVDKKTNIISTIAGKSQIVSHKKNNPLEKNPLNLNLPKICSMDYYDGFLFIPDDDEGDLIIFSKK